MVACFRNLFGGMVDAGVDDFSSLSYLFDWFFLLTNQKIIKIQLQIHHSLLDKLLVHRPLYPNGPFEFGGFFLR